MSNTCFNTIALTGPRPDRQRFVADVSAAPWHDFLDVHVPVPAGAHPTEYWGTKGIKDLRQLMHTRERTEYAINTAWGPPWQWLERVAPLFPTLRLELFFGSVEGAFGGYVFAESGRVITFDQVEGSFADFFAERGRPGFFIPYWENEEELAREAQEEELADILDEQRRQDREDLLPSIGEVEFPPDPYAGHPEWEVEPTPSIAELAEEDLPSIAEVAGRALSASRS